MLLLFTKVPTPPRIRHIYHNTTTTLDILKDPNLLGMVIINGMQKGLMTVAFVLIPLILTNSPEDGGFAWETSDLWKAYLPAMIFGLIAMGPAAVFGEKYNKAKQIFLISIVLFIIAFLLMGFASSAWIFIVGVVRAMFCNSMATAALSHSKRKNPRLQRFALIKSLAMVARILLITIKP